MLISAQLKPNYTAIQKRWGDSRTPERLIAHYELERRLADRLRAGSQGERSGLYGEVYSKLFDSLQDHPQNTDELPARRVADRLRLTDALIDFAVAPPKASNWRCRLHPLVCGEGDSRESSWGHGARDKITNIKRTDDVPHRLPEAEHRSRRTCCDAT